MAESKELSGRDPVGCDPGDKSPLPTGRPSSEAELVHLSQKGDHPAFEELIRSHSSQVMKLAVGMLGSRVDAEDVTQEAFCRAYRKLSGFRRASSFSTWMYQITLNICRDALRRRKSDGFSTQSLELNPDAERVTSTRDLSPETAASGAEELKELLTGVDQLSSRHRAALLLRVDQGLPHQEIAKILGTTTASSRVYVAEARKILLRRLQSVQKPARKRGKS